MTEVTDPALWWKQAVVYQVYPRSFKDSRGEGLGQIAGVTEKIDYLKDLGVDAIWLSPFYPSQLADGGYDVDDSRNVDPKLGTMDDFDELAKAAHARDIKVVVDIVPNHSSNLHEWFKAALAAEPGSPERDRYIFRDGKGPNGDQPPTNWENHFGGPAWTRVPDGQWITSWLLITHVAVEPERSALSNPSSMARCMSSRIQSFLANSKLKIWPRSSGEAYRCCRLGRTQASATANAGGLYSLNTLRHS